MQGGADHPGGRPLGSRAGLGDGPGRRPHGPARAAAGGGISEVPEAGFENIWGGSTHNTYGMCAMRHMHEYGTTSEQLAWIKVAASHHAQWNEHAMLREVVTVEDVVNSPMIADPLHRLDCCVVSDGGGAVIVVAPEVAKSLKRPLVKIIGHGERQQGPARRQQPRPDLFRRGLVGPAGLGRGRA